MVLYKDKSFVTRSDAPDTDFMGDADFVIPDDSETAQKIIGLYPNFDFVFDDDGNIADVTATEPVPAEVVPEPPTNAELAAAIAELAEVIMNG
mgnify:CR=1 FL=1